jgi:chromosome segregation ATPase
VAGLRSTRNLTEPDQAEQQVKDMKRLLSKADQRIRKLEERVADQKQQIRDLQAQTKHEDNLAGEREELKAEVADLKGEVRELTRANREQVDRIKALRDENGKLKTGPKIQPSNKKAIEADPRVLPRLVLS